MNIKDLRVGNKVNLYGTIATICRFDFNDRPPRGIAIEKGTGLKLTKDFLLKCGCIEDSETFILDRFKLIWKDSYKYWYVTDSNNGQYYSKVEFVHEWQNFYYVMNGEELIFN